MNKTLIQKILREYDKQHPLNGEFTLLIENLARDLLTQNNIRFHSITSRLKTRDSLEFKLERTTEDLTKLIDIKDLCGLRIITYFTDDVDKVSNIVQNEFDVDIEHSIDKRTVLDPDHFGYTSLHYVAKLPNKRLRLTEYKRFSDCIFEVQVRSILQHTWAEIEHDLGYKSKFAVPKDIRRRFSQLAGLLELADDEFLKIRNTLTDYESLVPRLISESPELVPIDKVTLASYYKHSKLVKVIDKKICSLTKCSLIRQSLDFDDEAKRLTYAGFNTISDIETSLSKLKDVLPKFTKYLAGTSGGEFPPGVCLFYLSYFEIARHNSLELILDFLANVGLSKEKGWANAIHSSFKKIQENGSLRNFKTTVS